MKKRRKRFVLVSILVFLLAVVFYRILIFKQEERKRVLKVGFYDNYPYFYINDKAKVCGDYNEIVKSLSKRLNFKVEYVNCSLLELLKELENGEIDLVVGINKTPEREKLFEFSKNCINEKKYSIYTNENIKYGNLEALNGKKMGYIKNELDNEKILNYLKSRNINVELVNGSSYKGIKTLLIDDKVDFIVDNSDSDIKNKGKDIKEIFQFSSGPKYIITNKNNKELINEIDQGLNSINVEQDNNNILDYKNFNKFFNDDINKHIFIIFALIVFSILFKKERKILTSIIKKNRIINDLKKDNYILYYQPIVDFKHNRVRSVEALLRLRKDGKLLTPYYFMKDIEDANMMKEITLWVLNRVIKDYNIIKFYDNINEKDFYISLNVSFNEIKDREFLKKIVKIVNDSKIIKNSICLEIIEKFGVEEIEKYKKISSFYRIMVF